MADAPPYCVASASNAARMCGGVVNARTPPISIPVRVFYTDARPPAHMLVTRAAVPAPSGFFMAAAVVALVIVALAVVFALFRHIDGCAGYSWRDARERWRRCW